MLYYEFPVGERTYKLVLNTRNTISLEKKLGMNPISIFGNGDRIPTFGEMIAVLHASLQKYEHGLNDNDVYEIFDKWLADGNTMIDFVPVIVEIYKASGIIREDEGNEKN